MPSRADGPRVADVEQSLDATRRRARLALFAAVAVLLFLIERLLPNPLPWVRLGLANAVTLVVLSTDGVRAAGLVVLLRLVLGGFFAGSLLGPQFWLAVAGAGSSFVVMSAVFTWGSRHWSVLGVSVCGSVTHALAQLLVVGVVFGAGMGVVAFAPVFLLLALLTGIITGVIADLLLARLELRDAVGGPQGPSGALDRSAPLG